jgi:pSer/pThr/pTyr-binding forkhead associated (FHA) protein
LGRGHESDLRISDISVSRAHARIFYEDDSYYIEDLASKFGTLMLATDPIVLENENKVLQIGRTLVSACKHNKEGYVLYIIFNYKY